MGLAFSLQHANWLAQLLRKSGAVPQLPLGAKDAVANHVEENARILNELRRGYISSERGERIFANIVTRLIDDMGSLRFTASLRRAQNWFSKVPWIGLIIPTEGEHEINHFLSSTALLRELVRMECFRSGLLLQVKEAYQRNTALVLDSVFPAFNTAFANATRWPGLLVWTDENNSCFFPIGRDDERAHDRLIWLIDKLSAYYDTPNTTT